MKALLILLAALAVLLVGCKGDDTADSTDAGATRDLIGLDTGSGGDNGSGGDITDANTRTDQTNLDAAVDPDGRDQGSGDTRKEDTPLLDPEILEPTVKQNGRVAFQYVGENGASHYVDDVVVRDTTAKVLDEGFEGGEIPENWEQLIQRSFFSWEILEAAHEAHTGTYSAKVVWSDSAQDEWLISPPFEGDGAFTLEFWNKGVPELAPSATLHVFYTCNDGLDWHELYVFPGTGETETYVWYENVFDFECPLAD